MATNNSGKGNKGNKGAASKPAVQYTPGASPLAGVKTVKEGGRLFAHKRFLGTGGCDCWGNHGGCSYVNRAIIALAAGGAETITLATVNPLARALALADGCEPRADSVNGSHITTLKKHLYLVPSDGLPSHGWPMPGRGVIVVSAIGRKLAEQAGEWAPLTADEEKAKDAYDAAVAKANAEAKAAEAKLKKGK